MRFLWLFLMLLFFGCGGEKSNENKQDSKENTIESKKEQETKENVKQFLDENTKESEEEPLKKQLKQNLKTHLNNLSNDLSSKNLKDLHFKDHGTQGHVEMFETLQNSTNLQDAHLLQEAQIEKLRQKNDEIGK